MSIESATRRNRAAQPTKHRAYQDHARYDDINRLKTFTEASTAQTYCYDRYGNRAMLNTSYIVASALTPQVGSCTTNGNDPNLPFTNNRTNNGNHDAAGNVRWDGATTYTFDAENRITNSTRMVGSLTTAVNYKYDGDGRRVRVEVTGGANTNFVYDAGGKLLAEYSTQAYPESGHPLPRRRPPGFYAAAFGSLRQHLQRFDYLPFGEELLTSSRTTALKYGVASIVKQRFTGQMRDGETNLDYFNARYLSPNQGRFMSVDPANAGASTGDPQSWNAYSYTINNPLLYVDPSGLSYQICAPNTPCITLDLNDEQFEEWQKENPNLAFVNGKIVARNPSGTIGAQLGSVSYVHDPKLSAGVASTLNTAGNRAARDTNTFMISSAIFATSFLSTYAAPAIIAGVVASSELGAVGPGVEFLRRAAQRGSELVKQYKLEGVGKGAGRSGGHGTPHLRAGAQMIREANALPKNNPMREALKTEGLRLLNKGKGINH